MTRDQIIAGGTSLLDDGIGRSGALEQAKKRELSGRVGPNPVDPPAAAACKSLKACDLELARALRVDGLASAKMKRPSGHPDGLRALADQVHFDRGLGFVPSRSVPEQLRTETSAELAIDAG